MEYELYEMEAKDTMKKAVKQYQVNLTKISAGRANPALLESVSINYFETLTPISQLSAISIPEPRQLLIKPFDLSINKDIVSAINKASLGVVAVDEGDKTRITLPEVTTERRRDLVKSLSKYTEQAKISIRSARQDVNKEIKADEELSEYQEKGYLNQVQGLTNEYTKMIDELTKTKEKDLMAI